MSVPQGRLPDFIIIGAAKSGTTTLFHTLTQHPNVFATPGESNARKEPCFFDPDVAWSRGFDWYRSLFAGVRDDQICGEASTNYTRFPQVQGVPERIHAAMPHVRLLYILRHPVERAFSHYQHRYSRELFPGRPFDTTFEDFVSRDPLCLDSSDYALQIEQYLRYFPPEQLLVLRFEKLLDDRARVLDRVQRFLGIPVMELPESDEDIANASAPLHDKRVRSQLAAPLRELPIVRGLARILPQRVKDAALEVVRRSPYGRRVASSFRPKPMLQTTRLQLIERFLPSIERVEALTGEDLTDWKR